MSPDLCGGMKLVSGTDELIQRIIIRLTMKKGSFALHPEWGSELAGLDIAQTDNLTLFSIVNEALREIEEVSVLEIERKLDTTEKRLYLIIYLDIAGKPTTLTLNTEGGR